jgi:hypothetical protein
MHHPVMLVALVACVLLFSSPSNRATALSDIIFPEEMTNRMTGDVPRIPDHTSAIQRHLEGMLTLSSSGGALASLGFPRHGLNDTCNNLLCEMMETAMSCKGLGFGISKICSTYILGFIFQCPIFPAPSDLFDAPSTCAGELAALLPPGIADGLLKSPAPPNADSSEEVLTGLEGDADVEDEDSTVVRRALGSLADKLSFNNVRKYIASDFTENCNRRCFQKYIEQSNAFYGSCSSELRKFVNVTDNTNKNYPLPYILESYQEFRNQVCTSNQNGSNCFGQFQQFLPDPTGVRPPPAVNIFQYDCNWFTEEPPNANGLNNYVFGQICEKLHDVGCCFGNQVAMLSQSQTNTSANKNHKAIRMFQPCLLRNLEAQCSAYTNPRNFCTAGANGNLTVVSGSVVIGPTRIEKNKVTLMNVYDENDVVFFQGVMSLNLLWDDKSPTKMAALQVEILNYAYFNSTIEDQSPATQLTPADGTLYYPAGGDFSAAKSARYDFQFVLQGLNEAESATFYNQLVNEQVCSSGKGADVLKFLYGAGAHCINVVNKPAIFAAQPIIPPAKGAAYRGVAYSGSITLIFLLLGLFLNAIV